MPKAEKRAGLVARFWLARDLEPSEPNLTTGTVRAAPDSSRWRVRPVWRPSLRHLRSLTKALGLAWAVGAIVGSGIQMPWGVESSLAEVGEDEATVAVQTFQFRPHRLSIRTGTGVTWTNEDPIAHTVTSGAPEARDGRFHSLLPGKGSHWSRTFPKPGIYPYFCERHPEMRGEIEVHASPKGP